MNLRISFLAAILGFSCTSSPTPQVESKVEASLETQGCTYGNFYSKLGNKRVDTLRIGQRLIDPIDDSTGFEKLDFGFVQKEGRIYKKAWTQGQCGSQFVHVAFYQDLTGLIDVASYREYDDRYFTTNKRVNFWWVNSGGHLVIPIEGADPDTFKPFPDICGGMDNKNVYYGCPNFGVHRLQIPVESKFEFIPKKDSYWNAPKHYVIVDQVVYDIKYDLKRGYFCEVDETVSKEEISGIKR